MNTAVTKSQIENVGNKIVSISKREGNVNFNLAKYYTNNATGEYVVITRKGISDYITHPTQMIPYVGKKGVHFQTFNSAKAAADFINKLAN